MSIAENSSADRPTIARRKLGLHRLDGRSSVAIRARQLVAELEGQIHGEITPLRRQAIERAALMMLLAEDLAARRLKGEPIPLDECLRAEGVARRSVAALRSSASAPRARSLSNLEWSDVK
jgi:hypothetical protein